MSLYWIKLEKLNQAPQNQFKLQISGIFAWSCTNSAVDIISFQCLLIDGTKLLAAFNFTVFLRYSIQIIMNKYDQIFSYSDFKDEGLKLQLQHLRAKVMRL